MDGANPVEILTTKIFVRREAPCLEADRPVHGVFVIRFA
jgi:hypothetical protein